MNRILPAALAALLLLLANRTAAEPGQFSERWETLNDCRLIENAANDGDSFHVRHAGKEYIFRLYYVDTPEVHDVTEGKTRTTAQAREMGLKKAALYELAAIATQFSSERLQAAPFTVITRWEDAKGASRLPRCFAVIETAQGDLAELLVANGMARIHGHHLAHPRGASADRYAARLAQLEEKAKKARLGAWGMPAESRRGAPAAKRPAKAKTKATPAPKAEIPAF